MIVDRLSNAHRYLGLHPRLAAAFTHLQRADLAQLPEGRVDLAADGGLYALHQRPAGVGQAAARLEAHRKFIDVQYTVAGDELIGWRSLADCGPNSVAYDAAKDIGFFAERPALWVPVPPGFFTIFFPEDTHAPIAATGPLHKVVVKMAVG